MTYPDGGVETIKSNVVIDSGLSNDGNSTILKEKDNEYQLLAW